MSLKEDYRKTFEKDMRELEAESDFKKKKIKSNEMAKTYFRYLSSIKEQQESWDFASHLPYDRWTDDDRNHYFRIVSLKKYFETTEE